ncbi:MAG TPA: metallophosphoesterase family protein [Gaiellaceae bacterium]|nr:metallophosphoesterase family protein [Gaiellaceae bacterium]
MRVAALYDVHGNLPALEAVLAEADAELLVVGGDVVGGPFPAEAVARLRGLGDRALWLRGNAERELVEEEPPREGGAPPGELERLRAALTEEQVAFLYGLPERLELDVDGLGRVLFCHAVPQNDLDIVTPLTPGGRLARIVADVEADVVVAGHTHMQDDRRVGAVRWVNAGSVGMAYEDEPGAYWALLGPGVELERTAYDRAALGDYEYPQASRREAAEYFESLVRD